MYANLKVTVGQTQGLTNQVVRINWTGAPPPPRPVNGNPTVDFLQFMQCWGDSPAGPDRTQCEYGGLEGQVGTLGSRRVSAVNDPEEPLTKTPHNGDVYVPFDSQDGHQVNGDIETNTYFDVGSTNEISNGRTRADGTGNAYFETLTGAQAPGLGCGNPTTSATGERVGRSCWLVIVPRGEKEVDGSDRSGPSSTLESSPLSMSNWQNRLVVPLQFQPLGTNCSLGSAEHRIYGEQTAAQAVYHWQSTLCDQTGAVYGFSSTNENIARTQLLSGNPNLELLNQPVAPEQRISSKPVVYAPITLSAPAIAFNIDSQAFSAPESANNGQRISTINLTPRLVAKLLTESYQFMDSIGLPYLKSNPADFAHDPDFLQYNPAFRSASDPTKPALNLHPSEILLPSTLSDASAVLWKYVNADSDARSWLNGTPDPWGMTVNPYFKGLDLPRQDFPKADLNCQESQGGTYCIFDRHPYANDPFAIARLVNRGDPTTRNSTIYPYPANPPQQSGFRDLLGVTDLPDAALYQLPTVSLRNAAGQFVAPTTTSLRTAANAMTVDSVTQTAAFDPANKVDGAYPTAMITYAATTPADLSAADGKAYAAFIRYAVDGGQIPGQQPGNLPEGYTPLPASFVAQAEDAATVISSTAGQAAASTATPASSSAPSGTPSSAVAASRKGSSSGSSNRGPSASVAAVPPAAAAAAAVQSAASSFSTPGPAPSRASVTSPVAAAASQPPAAAPELTARARTPAASSGFARAVVVLVLVVAVLLFGTGFGLPNRLRRLPAP